MNFCPKCGQPVNPNDNVCANCGRILRPTSSQQATPAQQYNPEKPKNNLRPIIFVGIIAVLIIALVGSLLFLVFHDDETEPDDAVVADSVDVLDEAKSTQESVPALADAAVNIPVPEAVESPTAAPITEMPYYVTGVSNQIKVRSDVDTSSVVLTKLENNDMVKLLDNSDAVYWKVRVEDEQIEGYIDSRFLTDEQSAVISPRDMYVSGVPAYLTLASTNGADYTELGRAYNGDTVTVLAEPDGNLWYVYIESLRSYGYVLKDYLSNEKPTPTPAPTPTPTPAPRNTAPAAITNYYMYVTGVDYYLALRSEKAYSASNEIGKLYNGEAVQVLNDTTGTYWYVYAPSLGMYGYVNSDYLFFSTYTPPSYSSSYWTVTGVTYYLALRSEPRYDWTNEIGKLYNGESVEVIDTSLGDYWYVYAPTLGMYGYVNYDYLR